MNKVPMLVVFLGAALGIVLSDGFVVQWPILIFVLALFSGVCTLKISGYYLILTVALAFAGLHLVKNKNIAQNTDKLAVIIENKMAKGDEWTTYSAVLSHIGKGDEWVECEGKIMLIAQNNLDVKLGEQVSFRGKINDDIYDIYKRRAYLGRVFLSENNIIARKDAARDPWSVKLAKLQENLVVRLKSLGLRERNEALASAMALGYRVDLDTRIKKEYSYSGFSHILALSGLHLAVVFALLNILLRPLRLLSHGHRIINVLSICFIWFYALLSGLSPSVFRAAIMFSLLQFSLFSSRKAMSLNLLAGAGVIILLFNTDALFDISFQLSFLAVFFIITCYSGVYRILKTKIWWINSPLSLFLVGFMASLGVMPLVSHVFGGIPTWGVIFSPFIILLATFILPISLIWAIFAPSWLEGVFRWCLTVLLDAQTALVDAVSAMKFSYLDFRMPLGVVIPLYIVMFSAALWLWNKKTLNYDFRSTKIPFKS